MSWKSRYRTSTNAARKNATPVTRLEDIPDEASAGQAFRLTVDVLRVTERCTKSGTPCYFLSLRDADGKLFSVVAWDSQWPKLEGGVREGGRATLDVHVPVGNYPAFTLAM